MKVSTTTVSKYGTAVPLPRPHGLCVFVMTFHELLDVHIAHRRKIVRSPPSADNNGRERVFRVPLVKILTNYRLSTLIHYALLLSMRGEATELIALE